MSEDRVGQEIAGKYRLVRLLGKGGMGVVYEAQHTVIGRRFAIKFLHRPLVDSSTSLARFRREAQAAGSLESEHIAAVTDFGTEQGAPYIVMEYLTGEDLSRLLGREGKVPVVRLVDIVIQACRGLHVAHAAGIVHRDLKPENLFLTRRGDGSDLVKVLDFGVAKLRPSESPAGGTQTQTGATIGTPSYMAPEQARGEKDLDHRTDVYALGVILYEGLSGTKPHPGESYNEILYHILSRPIARLESLRSDLPQGLVDVVHRALAFAPGDRYPGVAELADALLPFAERAVTPIAARSDAAAVSDAAEGRTIDTPPSVEGAPLPAAMKSLRWDGVPLSPAQHRTGRVLAVTTLAALTLGAVVLFVSKRDAADTSPAASVNAVAAAPVAAPRAEPEARTPAPLPSREPAPVAALPPALPSAVPTPARKARPTPSHRSPSAASAQPAKKKPSLSDLIDERH